jgi:hypothetical protein
MDGLMKIKTEKLTGHALNWAVSKCEHDEGRVSHVVFDEDLGVLEVPHPDSVASVRLNYSSNWNKAGPILTRERISRTIDHSGLWIAYYTDGYTEGDEGKLHMQCDKDELVAGLRCYVALRLGEFVRVPDEIAN